MLAYVICNHSVALQQTCWNRPWWKGKAVPPGFCLPAKTATSNCSGEICISSIKLPSIKSTYTRSRLKQVVAFSMSWFMTYHNSDSINLHTKCLYSSCTFLYSSLLSSCFSLGSKTIIKIHESGEIRMMIVYQHDLWIGTYSKISLRWMFATVHSRLGHAESKSTNRKPTNYYPRPFYF